MVDILPWSAKLPDEYLLTCLVKSRFWAFALFRKTEDGRYKSAESLLENIDRKKTESDSRRPLTEGEAERLTEEFVVEFTYNSNAIEGNTLTLRETDVVREIKMFDSEYFGFDNELDDKDVFDGILNRDSHLINLKFY